MKKIKIVIIEEESTQDYMVKHANKEKEEVFCLEFIDIINIITMMAALLTLWFLF